MKKKLALFLVTLLLASVSVFAHTVTNKYKVADFKGIKAAYVFKITLTKGPVCSVEISCPDDIGKYLTVSSSNGILELSAKRNSSKGNDKRHETVYVKIQMPSLTYLDLSGASTLIADGEFNETAFECNLSGACALKYLNINARNFTFDISGAAKASLEGNFTNAQGNISGAASVTFNGNMDILRLKTSGASNTVYNGNSSKIHINTSGAANSTLTGKTDKLLFKISGAANLDAREMITQDFTGEDTGVGQIYLQKNHD